MKKLLLIVFLLCLMVGVFFVTPASAVVWGEPDGQRHPYVGVVVFWDEEGHLLTRCSGTLLSPTVFLTAGHCAYGTATATVWFASKLPPSPPPPDGVGTPIVHPNYTDTWDEFPNTYDVAVVLLSEPVEMGSYGVLPELGALDGLDRERGKKDQIFRVVGYGLQETVPNPKVVLDNLERYTATPQLVELNSANTGGYNIHLSTNPGKKSPGGDCFGDSGGPVFYPKDSNIVVGISSFGFNKNCVGADFSYRTDIPDTQDFVNGYLP